MFNVLYSFKWFFCVKLCYEKFFNRRDIKLEEKNNIIQSLTWLPTYFWLFNHFNFPMFYREWSICLAVWPDPVVLLYRWHSYCPGYHSCMPLPAMADRNETGRHIILQFLTSLGMVNYLFNQFSHVLHPS